MVSGRRMPKPNKLFDLGSTPTANVYLRRLIRDFELLKEVLQTCCEQIRQFRKRLSIVVATGGGQGKNIMPPLLHRAAIKNTQYKIYKVNDV